MPFPRCVALLDFPASNGKVCLMNVTVENLAPCKKLMRVEVEAQKVDEGELAISFENRYRCKDGSYRWLLWSASPFAEQQLIYAAARDITQRKWDEAELREAAGRDLQDRRAPVGHRRARTAAGRGRIHVVGLAASGCIGGHAACPLVTGSGRRVLRSNPELFRSG